MIESRVAPRLRAVAGVAAASAVQPARVSYAGDEAVLLDRLKRGDPGAQVAFIDAFEPIARRVIVRVLGVGPDLADALQEALLRTFRGVGAVHGSSGFVLGIRNGVLPMMLSGGSAIWFFSMRMSWLILILIRARLLRARIILRGVGGNVEND